MTCRGLPNDITDNIDTNTNFVRSSKRKILEKGNRIFSDSKEDGSENINVKYSKKKRKKVCGLILKKNASSKIKTKKMTREK